MVSIDLCGLRKHVLLAMHVGIDHTENVTKCHNTTTTIAHFDGIAMANIRKRSVGE